MIRQKKALEMRDFFISLAAHELRTPLTAIHGYIQLLQKRLDKKEMNVEQEWVQEMYAESIKLTSLINELLEINRIERKKEQFFFAECELLAIINFAVERAAIMHPQHTFIVKKNMHSSDMIIADIDKIRQVMTSLLDNAAKFSPLGSEIIIKIQSVKNSFTITIIDKGEGITSEDLAHVFEGFYKGKNNHKTGMGVGLLLAKHTLEAHHGSIAVTSEIGKGTTVTLTIPRSRIGVTPS